MPIIIRNAEVISARVPRPNPGTVDVVVYPPISTDDWTVENVSDKIAEVRQLYLDTLRDWPHDSVPKTRPYARTRSTAKKTAAKKAAPRSRQPRRRRRRPRRQPPRRRHLKGNSRQEATTATAKKSTGEEGTGQKGGREARDRRRPMAPFSTTDDALVLASVVPCRARVVQRLATTAEARTP